jgi:hypothetical protein
VGGSKPGTVENGTDQSARPKKLLRSRKPTYGEGQAEGLQDKVGVSFHGSVGHFEILRHPQPLVLSLVLLFFRFVLFVVD